ncbi:MAG TPA: hypothetical protein VFT69_05340 [Pseudolabrys sp.]|jgi:hypothetical protein|nr:hypothetical protein [Pseudolabrys sp.]
MNAVIGTAVPADLIAELERRYFWWEPIAGTPRSDNRIIAQAMDLAGFADVRRLETEVGAERLVDVMRHAQPGWISPRSWEFWRGRLSYATGQEIPKMPPRRTLHAAV